MWWVFGLVMLGMATSTAAGSPAEAPEPQQFFGIGAALGGSNNGDPNGPRFGTINAGFALELGQRVDVAFLHEQITAGVGGSPAGGGEFVLARFGVETRLCGRDRCGIFGLDVGYEHEDYGHGALDTGRLVPRVGLDVGGKTVRFRPSIDVALGIPGAFESNVGTGTVFVNFAIAWQGN